VCEMISQPLQAAKNEGIALIANAPGAGAINEKLTMDAVPRVPKINGE